MFIQDPLREPLSVTGQEIKAWLIRHHVQRMIQTLEPNNGGPKHLFLTDADTNTTCLLWGETWDAVYVDLCTMVLADVAPLDLIGDARHAE